MSKDEKCVPYLELEIQLHGCVFRPEAFIQDLNYWLKNRLAPDPIIIIGVTTFIAEYTAGKPVDMSSTIDVVKILERRF